MKTWIKNLLELQTSDLRIKKMKQRLREIPKEKQEIEHDLSHETVKIEKAKGELLGVEKEIRKIESKIDGIKEKIKALQDKSVMIKKNEEYKAMLSEIGGHKAAINGLENNEIDLIDKLETKKEALDAALKALDYIKNEANENIEELDDLSESLKAEIDKMLEERKKLIEKVDTEVLPLYNSLIRKPGEPLTKIHNKTCGSCHLKLTPQTLNNAKKELISICDTCGHLIYFSEE